MIYESYSCPAVGCDRCALPAFAFYAYVKAQHGVNKIWIVFSMSEYDEFYGRVIRERSYGFVINPLRTLNVGLRRKEEKRLSLLFIHSLEWICRKDMLFFQPRIPISIKKICRIRRFLTRCFLADGFLPAAFSFSFSFFLFFPVVFFNNFLLTVRCRL